MMGDLINNKASQLMRLLTKDQVDLFLPEGKHCLSRDNFQAQLDLFYHASNNPLLTAVCGEIGNNSFDHNLGNWRDLPGVYFEVDGKNGLIVLVDRGQGVRKTLSRILPDIRNDKAAVQTAFEKTISGRSPEQRGNGLKFVAAAFKKNPWELFFQSGRGTARIVDGVLSFAEAADDIKGCLAVIKY